MLHVNKASIVVQTCFLSLSINGTPACANKYLLTEILRNEWGYKGSVISDNNGVENIYSGHHYVNDTYDVSTGRPFYERTPYFTNNIVYLRRQTSSLLAVIGKEVWML